VARPHVADGLVGAKWKRRADVKVGEEMGPGCHRQADLEEIYRRRARTSKLTRGPWSLTSVGLDAVLSPR